MQIEPQQLNYYIIYIDILIIERLKALRDVYIYLHVSLIYNAMYFSTLS